VNDIARFDTRAVFDEDYLFFYEEMLGGAASDRAVEAIWRLLDLRPGARVLDLACGHGRIANRLADRGCRVTALDVTPLFLERARQDAERLGVEVEYVEGDMRSLPWENEFDAIVSWFTSFGYFSDEENRHVLREAAKAVRPGGSFLIENNNLPAILRGLREVDVVEREGRFMLDRRRFDVSTNRMLTERIALGAEAPRRAEFFVRMFTFPELRDWLLDAGFAEVKGYGGLGEPLTLESWRLLTVARRSG
jgi:SAM-dependent methyltransferase